ncbi:MAG: argininosuccinate synthase [Candidatus Eisenbacteria bacterium]|nr:argininosuccinate synthase [Candidatus Eisenbacteria bacterium]MCC7144743.1 argininosuccinate synthase [Candidatus Eisenbacteria bacterium]
MVLAFSGGLDTSFCVPWLREQQGAEVVTVTVDTGGLDAAARRSLAARARELGAKRHLLIDARAEFFSETLRFLIMGNVLRGHLYPLCVGAERTLQARKVAEVAAELKASAVAHGCTAAGNDQVRFEVALRTFAPRCAILAPIRDEALSREAELAYLAARGYAIPGDRAAYSINAGLWGVTIGGRETNGTVESLPESAWAWSAGALAQVQPSRPLRIGFERGVPQTLDGRAVSPVTLIERLNALGAGFAIGRGIHLGDTILGLKGRVAFEAPAATLLIAAHRELEKLTLTGRQQRLKDLIASFYGDWVHEGQSLDPACRDAEALLLRSQERVTGEVRLSLRTGGFMVEGVTSPHSLASASRGVYGEAAGEWTAEDARGYSRLLALPSMLHARAGVQ